MKAQNNVYATALLVALLFLSTNIQAQSDKQKPNDWVAYGGLGAGKGGFSADAGIVFRNIGFGITMAFAQTFSAPATTGGIDNTDFDYVSSNSQKYDMGYASYEFIGRLPLWDVVVVDGGIGYYSHTWARLQTTTDDQGILEPSTKQIGSGTYSSGLAWGAGLHFYASSTIMVGARYSSIGSGLFNIGYRF